MIEYIKMLLIALVCGATFPLPTSSAAHFSFLNSVMNFSSDVKLLGFYYSVMALTFSAVTFFMLRKIFSSSVKSLFVKDGSLGNYRTLMKKILLSLIPMAVLFVPVSEGKLLCDLFDNFLGRSNLLLVGFASIISALVLVISIWYTKQGYGVTDKGAGTKTVLRSSVYQVISYVIPGISHVSSASTNMLICDVESKVIVREAYLYIAPQMFLVSLVKIIRYLVADVIINPLLLIICVVVAGALCAVVITKMSKINIRRILPFFAAYSAVSGILFAVLSFVLK